MTPIAVGEYHEIHSVATDAVSKASSGAIGMARSGQLSWGDDALRCRKPARR